MKQSWAGVRKLLCVRLDSLGDVLMTTPALRALRESLPDCHLTLLTSAAGAAAARHIPEIDDALVFAAPWMKTAPGAPAEDLAMVDRLAALGFDAAVIFTVYSQNPLPAAYLCYLAGIPLRLAHCRENPYGLLTDWEIDPEPQDIVRHEVRRQLELVGTVGALTTNERLSFTVPLAATGSAIRRLAALDIDRTRPLVVVHPGASAASRRYPPAQFARAIDLLTRQTGCEVVFTGDANERSLASSIREDMHEPTHVLAGELSLAELAALIGEADLLVSNNTGPAHLAAALGTPVVDLYALTNPQHTPWQVPCRVLFHDVPCRFCYKSVCPEGHQDCLRLVAPESVAEAALELLSPVHARSY
jgi:lipopolysaccharide heptosyltransferase II